MSCRRMAFCPLRTAEMRYIGPIVRNDSFFFVTMLALAGLMILMEQRRRTPTPAPKSGAPGLASETWEGPSLTPAQLRKASGPPAASVSGCPPSS